MKNLTLICLCIFVAGFTACSPSSTSDQTETQDQEQVSIDPSKAIQGAWSTQFSNDMGEDVTVTTIVTDGYIAESFYNESLKKFHMTVGGLWHISADSFYMHLEFNSNDSTEVGKTLSFVFDLQGDTIRFEGDERIWTRVDDMQPGDLAGAWLITGRKRDGEMRTRTPGPRKTMKILSGTRFQWIAYHTETGRFSGTGGGTYTTVDGVYTENIDFFSRDSSRVGASLNFNYELIDQEWHHSGLSSRGDSIYEVWSMRKLIENQE